MISIEAILVLLWVMMVYPRMWLLWDFVRMINGCSLSGRTVQPEYRTWGKSCTTNLIETLDCIGRLLDRGSQIEVIYLAMSKAFDNVKHAQLLSKLHIFGIGGKLFNLDLNNVRSWSTKSHCQSITRKTKPLNTAYDMNEAMLEKTSHERDLGVGVSTDPIWNKSNARCMQTSCMGC